MTHRDGRSSSDPATDSSLRRALFCGGGSGGHVFPGLAVAQELMARGWQVDWTGSEHGMEQRLVERHGVTFHALPARPLVGQGMVGKLRSLLTLMTSVWRARGLVRRLGAEVIVGTGGYVSAATVLGARLARRPVLLLEPNAEVGFANRWLSRWADEAAVVSAATGEQLACPSRETGIPIRGDFFTVDEAAPAPPVRLLVLGGSQGAQQINRVLPSALRRLRDEGIRLAVCHQCGAKHVDATRQVYREAGIVALTPSDATPVDAPPSVNAPPSIELRVVPFLDDMVGALQACHLVVSRAGAITLAELCAAGRPSLLLPLSLAAAHQVGNARRLVAAGAAEMLGSEADEGDMSDLLGSLCRDTERLTEMATAARSLGKPRAATDIAERVEHWAGLRRAA